MTSLQKVFLLSPETQRKLLWGGQNLLSWLAPAKQNTLRNRLDTEKMPEESDPCLLFGHNLETHCPVEPCF
jgi:hypothetical protein